VLRDKYYCRDVIKEYKMGGTCRTHGTNEEYVQNFNRKKFPTKSNNIGGYGLDSSGSG
jgi:hypothetical protein